MIGVERTGIILHAERYDESVRFYRDALGLAVEFTKNEPGQVLTLFSFGGAYLMLEPGGAARERQKTSAENPVTIRFNVTDVDAAADELRKHRVAVAVAKNSWGAVADFTDPDGNHCQLREARTFAQ